MEVWELAARHDQERRMGHTDKCKEIQKVVEGLPLCDQVLIKKLNFYKPV